MLKNELARLGIAYKHSRPYQPQTCGKVVQAQLDRFRTYYNTVRPHRAIGRRPPAEAFAARTKATPEKPPVTAEGHHRVRRDRIDKSGTVTLRYRSRLFHIGAGRIHAGVRVLLLVNDLDVRVITEDGEQLCQLTLDPTKTYQPTGRPRARPGPNVVLDLLRQLSGMSRNTTRRPRQDSNLRPAA